jgi:hypothetical protein
VLSAHPRLALGLSIGLLLVAAPTAAGKPFGANLDRVPDSTATCQDLVPYQRVDSCSWATSGSLGNVAETMIVPGTGTITQVQVRVGSRTGPMRVAILQSLRRENAGESACCIGRLETASFTPKPNAIATLQVHMLVSVSFNQQSRTYAYDTLFLTMDDASTPIPANRGNPNGGNCSGGWFPAVRPGQENFSGPYGICGATILVRAEWQPAAGAATATGLPRVYGALPTLLPPCRTFAASPFLPLATVLRQPRC